jgi:hypothetical protein
LLANIETADEKLLPLVLAGQPELSARLEDGGLRQLKQRVALRCEIEPFQLSETAAYIATRIKIAGGVPSKLFTREGVSLIHEHSRGIPRVISVICDNALVSGMALERQPVDTSVVLEVCRDFHLHGESPERGPSVPARETDVLEEGVPIPEPPTDTDSVQDPVDNARTRRFTFFGSQRR